MMFAVGVLLVLAALGGAALRVASLHLAADRTLRSRKLDLEERSVAIQEQKAKGAPVPASIPPDLYRRIMNWGETLAQESERKIILDLYAEVADQYDSEDQRWAQVRSLLPKPPSENDEPVLFS